MFYCFFSSKMPNCVAHNCDYTKTEKGHYQSFLFPEDPDVKRKWLKNLRRAHFTPTATSAICQRHFTEEDFETIQKNKYYVPKRRTLKVGAVPTLFMVPEHEPRVFIIG